jgi:hypothetical protein
MNKSALRDKIRMLVKKVYSGGSVDLDTTGGSISLDTERFPILNKFPQMKEIIIDLLTDQYDLFIKDILWAAPRPTTFIVKLLNGQSFYLIHTDKSWIAKVEGKKYYLLNLPEEERAAESIARILSYLGGEEEVDKTPEKGEEESTEETSTEEKPSEEETTEET